MATNQDFPFGFRAIRNVAGTVPRIRTYTASATGTIYEGMPVMLNASGYLIAWTCTAGTFVKLIGVAAHARKTTDTARTCKVYVDPEQEYEVQLDDGSVSTLAGLILKPNFPLINVTAGNTTTLQSKAELDASANTSFNNTTTLASFRVNRFSPIVTQDNATAHQRVIGRFVRECLFLSADQ